VGSRSASGFDLGPLSVEQRERLAKDLSAEERRVLLDRQVRIALVEEEILEHVIGFFE